MIFFYICNRLHKNCNRLRCQKMKKTLLLLGFVLFATIGQAQVGINTTTPSSNSALEVNSRFSGGTYGGFMPPKLTIAQRDAIAVTSADDGLMAYVSGFTSGERCLQIYNGVKAVWESIKCFDAANPVVVWSETMGSPASATNATTYTGYDTYGTSTFTSASSTKPTVSNVAPTSNITGASGAGFILFTGAANRDLTIGGINVSSYTGPLTLQLLMYKGASTTSTGSELTIEYFSVGTWYNVTVTNLPTGTGTDNTWYSRTLSINVPNTITQLRFTRTSAGGGPEFRIDDIKIIRP